jgi:hypothetical protein
MNRQEHREEKGREALGGCAMALIIFAVFPVTLAVTSSFIAAAGVSFGLTVFLAYGMNK